MRRLAEDKLIIATFKELEQNFESLGIDPGVQFQPASRKASRFESHEGYDVISLSIPHEVESEPKRRKMGIYFRKELLIFACDGEDALDDILGPLDDKIDPSSLEQLLYIYFNQLTANDTIKLEEIDQEISALEEAFMTSADQGGEDFKKIIKMRKRLLALKLYYGQLVDIAEGINENGNQLISSSTAKRFHLLTRRAERLNGMVLDLLDYLSQVREGYQEQIDIDQNKIMKLFTVITVIFLPLTLIVGWYGMNLKMPEYQSLYAYPIVIALSVAVSSFSIFYFKKHHWF